MMLRQHFWQVWLAQLVRLLWPLALCSCVALPDASRFRFQTAAERATADAGGPGAGDGLAGEAGAAADVAGGAADGAADGAATDLGAADGGTGDQDSGTQDTGTQDTGVPADGTSSDSAGCQPANCDDSNDCTVDGCEAGACKHTPTPDGELCGDDHACMAGDCLNADEVTVLIPGGNFQMGCNSALDQACDNDEIPQHLVTLPTYRIDLVEVTAQRFKACVANGACVAPTYKGAKCTYGVDAKAGHPVNCVTPGDAAAFCQWSGGRLPTEAEWERAARGSCKGGSDCTKSMPTYPWGETVPTACSLANFGGCGNATSAVTAHPDGKSPYGALGMAGNVAEWVADWYAADYYQLQVQSAPKGPPGGTERVVRGGSFYANGKDLRGGGRSCSQAGGGGCPSGTGMSPYDPAELGFRCVREPE